VNRSEVIDGLAERLGDKAVAAAALDGLIDIVGRSLAKGERVAISGFGTWERVERPARVGRNPATGQSIRIKKSAAPKFKAGNTLKGVVSGTTKLGREPKHTPLLPANITSASVRKKVDAALGVDGAAAPAAKAPVAKAPARKAPVKAAAKAPVKAAAKAVKAPAKIAAAKTAPARRAVAKAAPAAKPTVRRAAAAAAAPAKRVAAAKATTRPATKAAPAKRTVVATKAKAPAAKAVPARRASTAKVDAAQVRSWAIANKVPVSSRGRIGADIVAQYQAANK
jgi:DNA-binding protein HU-beta